MKPEDDERFGARWDGEAVVFRYPAPDADTVEVALFCADRPMVESDRLRLERMPTGIFAGRAACRPGQLYGLRVDGPVEPEHGHRFDPEKLLIDPWARAVDGQGSWGEALLLDHSGDSGGLVPRSVVIDGSFDWGDDRQPRVPWGRSVIYECHVRGLTQLHPGVPEDLRGTFLGLVREPVLEHLLALGITAVELLPVQHFATERHLAAKGLTNYWGYSPIAPYAPYSGYARGGRGRQVIEFKTMVRQLHRAGLEIILDVVFNHTAEGGLDGTILGPRGLDNRGFYRLEPDDRSRYVDYTGCGNTLDLRVERTRAWVLDCLRYWVREMHVDGFRFDLAPVLGRGESEFSATAPFFEELRSDPLLSTVKLIAEPWDLGPQGYQVGGFPDGWREWNDRYRDDLRIFWRGDPAAAPRLATRLAGSSDLYHNRASGPLTGVDFVTCHDGFTLDDLVSYERKRNWQNGEDNRDGRGDNSSCGWGAEGPSDDPEVRALRLRAKKNLLASLALSAGVPMLSHGDELGRTQNGNNNAYCHDSPLSWVSWDLDAEDRELLDFVRHAFALRAELKLFDRETFFAPAELEWLDPAARQLSAEDWGRSELAALQMQLRPAAGGAGLVVLLNAGSAAQRFELPEPPDSHRWCARLDTGGVARSPAEAPVVLAPYSLAALVAVSDGSGPGSGRG